MENKNEIKDEIKDEAKNENKDEKNLNKKNSTKEKIGFAIVIIVILISIIFILMNSNFFRKIYENLNINTDEINLENKEEIEKENETKIKDREQNKDGDVNVVKTFKDKITEDKNYVWASTFEMVGNLLLDMEPKNISNPELEDFLDKITFSNDNLNEDDYLIYAGVFDDEKKAELVKEIEEKLNTSPDLLKELDPSNIDKLLYSILYKNVEFETTFMELDNQKYNTWNNEQIENFQSFGFDKNGTLSEELDQKILENMIKQVEVLYYNSPTDFAFKIIDKEGQDELIFLKEDEQEENTFEDRYLKIENETSKYKGRKELENDDVLMIPKLNINVKKEFTELINSIFLDKENEEWQITEALQTIKFKLNESGAKLKSEAAIGMVRTSIEIKEEVPMNLVLNSDFTLFMKEKGEDKKPYFGFQVSDIESIREK